MFVFYAILISALFVGIDLIYFKIFQLERYDLKNYFRKIFEFNLSLGSKTKLNFTGRIKRLMAIDFLIKFIVLMLFFGLIPNFWINFVITIFLFFLSEIFVCLSFLLAHPIEDIIKKTYLTKAKKKLKSTKCKIIAITGSYGKTSTKNILYQILKEEFDVCATPKSFNTPMGICKTILEDLKESDDFLIVEYGARHVGDIEFLAKNFGVDFGIITPIGQCHLETFGSVENIENEKFELCQEAKDIVIFNGRSHSTKKLFERFKHKKYLVCSNQSFAYAKEIKTSLEGSCFEMCIDGNVFSCQTKLLGKSNIDNIVQASAMAYLLKESIFNIQRAIKNLKPVPHRLELIYGNGVKVVDDSYNSNFDGFCQALEVVSQFEGRKIVVSPGIVELGKQQYETNKKVASKVASVADVFVIMNLTNQQALKEGSIENGMKESQIYFAKTRQEQKNLLKKIVKIGDIILFENDFPDNIK